MLILRSSIKFILSLLPPAKTHTWLGAVCFHQKRGIVFAPAQAITLFARISLVALMTLLSTGAKAQPLKPRIITLTPHATEMVYAAGGGEAMVATVQASDFPQSARQLPRIGSGLGVEVEPALAHRPTLIVGWPSPLLDRFKTLGFDTFTTDPRTLDDIPKEIDALGLALHTSDVATLTSQNLRHRIQALPTVERKDPVKVVILADAEAGYAIGGEHILNDVLKRCGAINVFGHQPAAAPLISAESLWATQPDLVIVGQRAKQTTANDTSPSPAPPLPAMMVGLKAQWLTVDADALFRPSPRFIDAATIICKHLQLPTQ